MCLFGIWLFGFFGCGLFCVGFLFLCLVGFFFKSFPSPSWGLSEKTQYTNGLFEHAGVGADMVEGAEIDSPVTF